MTSTQKEKNTSFGFTEVPWEEKADHVRGVFDRVASRYDLMNDLMSLGLHRRWKQETVAAIPLSDDTHLLDVAGGTGDIAFRFLDRLQKTGNTGHVTVCDINASMLNEGRNRAIDRNLLSGIDWLCGNAENLPLPESSVHAYTIGFGIRNVTDISAALRDAHRVLKPGGKFLCLEFSSLSLQREGWGEGVEREDHPPPNLPPQGGGIKTNVPRETLAKLYDAYSFHVIPRVGELVTGSADPYRYLVESIRRFPAPDTFAGMIESAGFSRVRYRSFAGGAVCLHSGWRI